MEQQIIADIGKTIRFTVVPDENTVDVLWVSKHMVDLGDYLHSIDAEPEEVIYLDRPNQGYWKWNGVNDYTDEFTDLTPVELI